jgi:3-phosphoshikimate 1-carboxyvinyltransferase
MAETPWIVQPGRPLRGEIRVPGDKSISHRAVLFNMLAAGPSTLKGLLDSEDLDATKQAARLLGATLEPVAGGLRLIPPAQLREPADVLDCWNSGTSMRLLTGIVAARPMFTALTGDASLRRRPMGRIVEPLRAAGVIIDGRSEGDRAPLAIRGPVQSRIVHELDTPSAQVVSALLMAGREHGAAIFQPRPSRDHTQRMLSKMGADIEETDGWVRLAPKQRLNPLDIEIPGDLSSTAFWLVAASIVERSDLIIRDVGVNPTRTGVLDALRAMGALVEFHPRTDGAEPSADLRVRAADLRGTRIEGDLALRCLDELPILAIAAAFAEGVTEIRDAEELRLKESDRITRVAEGLKALGVQVEEFDDGWRIQGGRPRGPATIDANRDHRIAMSFAVAGLVAGPVAISGSRTVHTSYPDFRETLEALSGS